MPTALVIGAGVAGPAVAMFLVRAGWRAELFEARPAPDAYAGSFLNVATNGLAVLETLGLRDALVADGHRAGRMVMLSGTGRELGVVPNGPAGELERGGVIVRRSHLHEVLRAGADAAGIPIAHGARLTGIRETADAVTASFADGRTARGDVLIAADGIRSIARTWIDPAAPEPRYSGLVGLGGFALVDGLSSTPETQFMVFGRRAFFGYLVRDDGTAYWFANLTKPEPERGSLADVPAETWLAELRQLHADDPHPVPAILDHTIGDVVGYPIHDLTHVPHWHRGRVVALGDAVHATSPSAGQGASLALEDAVTLARALRGARGHEAAFAEYQRVRQPRAEQIVRYARAINRQKRVTKSRLGVALRDAMLPVFLRNAMDDHRNDDLYNHRIDWDEQSAALH